MNIKKILITFVVLILIVSIFGACNKAPQQEQETTPTMAPETDAQNTEAAAETASPTVAPDPLSGLKYWLVEPEKRIYNILLLGLDELEDTAWARNDTTMILQINLDTNEFKLVSFMRDMLVDIPGQGEYRINNAHYRGGPELAIRTMKSVFDVDIDHYAVVDFVSFEHVMKIVGPIVVDIKDYEVANIQQFKGVVALEGEQVGGTITGEGENTLNYYQALAYARDRHSSGDNNERAGDKGRNERQREVIKAAWKAVKYESPLLIVPSVFMAMPYVETDMEPTLIISLLKHMMENDAQMLDMSAPESNWAAWKAEDGTKYTNDELEYLYSQAKASYEESIQPSETGSGEATPEPEAFPSYESWRNSKGYASVIEWSHNKTIRQIHDFLGID